MKKLIIYILFIVLLVFALPIIFTNKFEPVSVQLPYDYGNLSHIKLLHIETGLVEDIGLDEYVCGVVSAEMPATYEREALKAQAVVARTYVIHKVKNGSKHEGANICDSYLCCQAWISKEDRYAKWENGKQDEYWNRIVGSVNSTKGKYITYEGEPINALCHSNSGGVTELPVNVWGGDYPYLQVVETSGEDVYSDYSSEKIISKDELVVKMLENHPNFVIDFSLEQYIKILDLTDGGRVKNIQIGNTTISGVQARKIFELKSANFLIELLDDNIKFAVIGYGHGVGLSQSGSDALAKQGMDYKQIIKHYYKNIEI